MHLPDTTSPRAAVRWLAATVLVALVTACSVDRAGEPTDPSPTPSSSVTPGQPALRYDPIDAEFCDRAELHEVPLTFDLTVPPGEYVGGYNEITGTSSIPPSWAAVCRFEARENDDSSLRFGTRGHVYVVVYGDTSDVTDEHGALAVDAAARHRLEIDETVRLLDARSSAPPRTVETAAGWWDEGVYVQIEEPGVGARISVDVVYLVHGDNLFVKVELYADFRDDARDEGTLLAHDVARALIEEAVANVPLAESD